jgi:hypothetical protein
VAVYVAQAVDGGPLKIGCSANVPARLKQLEATYGQPLALLATLPGGRDEERAIHERFAAHRLGKTEQFRPVAEIMAFIGRPLLVSPDPDVVEVMDTVDERHAVIHLKGSAEYIAWLDEVNQQTHIPKAALVRLALAEYAKNHGLRKPPVI